MNVISAVQTQVLLVDDHHLLRSGLRALLNNCADMQVVGEAANGVQALELAQLLLPDVILMDISMPSMSGLEALAALKSSNSTAKVIMLSMYSNEEYIVRALQFGAVGYVLKDAAPQELQLAIQMAMRGEIWLSAAIADHVIHQYVLHTRAESQNTAPAEVWTNAELLTPRQIEVLCLLAEGLNTKKIAAQLGISSKTVETFRGQIMTKLELHDVAGLVRFAIRAGLVSL